MIQIEIDRFLQIFVVVTFYVIFGRVIEFRVICLLLRYYSVESVDFVSLLTLYAEYQESRNHSFILTATKTTLSIETELCRRPKVLYASKFQTLSKFCFKEYLHFLFPRPINQNCFFKSAQNLPQTFCGLLVSSFCVENTIAFGFWRKYLKINNTTE